MLRVGLRGIREILSTGSNFSKRIPIGADTDKVNAMTRIFMNSTIVTRVEGGRKDFKVAPLLQRPQRARDRLLLRCPRARDRDPALLGWPRLKVRDQLLLAWRPQRDKKEALPVAKKYLRVNLEQLLLVRKKSSSRSSGWNTEKVR
jgi:hypothetical protein